MASQLLLYPRWIKSSASMTVLCKLDYWITPLWCHKLNKQAANPNRGCKRWPSILQQRANTQPIKDFVKKKKKTSIQFLKKKGVIAKRLCAKHSGQQSRSSLAPIMASPPHHYLESRLRSIKSFSCSEDQTPFCLRKKAGGWGGSGGWRGCRTLWILITHTPVICGVLLKCVCVCVWMGLTWVIIRTTSSY